MSEAAGPSASAEEAGHVSSVRKTFAVFEDFGLALQEQDKEFSTHFDLNRGERRQVSGDIRVSKTEQRLEDEYAAEYWEQVRRDREDEDARLAAQLASHLALEEEQREKARLARDEAMARELEEAEKAAPSIRAPRPRTPSPPPDCLLGADLWSDFRAARRRGKAVQLPPGITPELRASLNAALKEEDEKLAQEVQDRELAKMLQSREKKRPVSQEQVDNDLNSVHTMIPQRNASNGQAARGTWEVPEGELINLAPARPPAPRPPPPPRTTSRGDSQRERHVDIYEVPPM